MFEKNILFYSDYNQLFDLFVVLYDTAVKNTILSVL